MKKIVLLFAFFLNLSFGQLNNSAIIIYGGVGDDVVLHGRRSTVDAKTVYIINKNEKRIFWKNDKTIRKVTLSPNEKYVAVITEETTHNGAVGNFEHAFHLLLFDRDAKLIKNIVDGILYSWDPNGPRIVYETGLRIEEKMGFSPIQTCIYDLEKDSSISLDFKTYDLNWVKFDRRIYFVDYETGKVKSYDADKMRSDSTALKGIYLSPNAEYYFTPNYEGADFALYDKKNINITGKILGNTGIAFVTNPEWVDDGGLLLKNQRESSDKIRHNLLFDIKKGNFNKFDGLIVGSSNKGVVGIIKDGKPEIMHLKELKVKNNLR